MIITVIWAHDKSQIYTFVLIQTIVLKLSSLGRYLEHQNFLNSALFFKAFIDLAFMSLACFENTNERKISSGFLKQNKIMAY